MRYIDGTNTEIDVKYYTCDHCKIEIYEDWLIYAGIDDTIGRFCLNCASNYQFNNAININ